MTNNLINQNQITNYPASSPTISNNINNTNNIQNNNNEDPMNQVLDDFFGNFFNDEGPTQTSTSNQIQISMGNNDLDIQPHIFFHSFFSPFGIMNGVFHQNYLSNFGNLTDLSRLLQMVQRGRGHAHPPASQNALNKLKRFPLSERFCKKKDGKVDLPNCCICQSEIELGNETVLLPCGHMYHWECCVQWLKRNNTCPICRFEIK